tara:strand:+ start:77 stop:295 length:219 start_codon:yes stop_codon:yes gene_type:complete
MRRLEWWVTQQEAIHLIYDLRSVARDIESQPFGSLQNDLPTDTPIDVSDTIRRLRGLLDRLERPRMKKKTTT